MPDFGGNPYSGFGNDKGVEREKRTYIPQREEEIFSNNFGGLNVLSSASNCPYEDSPLLLNTKVDISGNVIKRQGTKQIYSQSVSTNGVGLVAITTGLQYNYLVIKNNQELGVYEVINDQVNKIITKSNVFTTAAASIRPSTCKTAEVEPRVIFTTGVNPPVQLRFVEQSSQINFGGGTTSAVISNASRFVNASTSNILVYINRVRQTGWSVSYNSGSKQLTITGLPNTTGTQTVDICLVVWQWFAEAWFYRGNRLWQSATRFNAITAVDNSVAVDQNLRDTINDESPTYPNVYPLRAWKSTNWNDAFTRSTNLEPPDNNSYCSSDGSSYNYFDNPLGSPCTHTSGRKMNPSPLFLTFGYVNNATTTSGNCGVASQTVPNNSASQIFISRRRAMLFNGNLGIAGSNLVVRVNGTVVPQSTTTGASNSTYGAYYLLDANWNIITNTSTLAFAIEFVAAAQMGLPVTAQVEFVNANPLWVGSAATSASDLYNDGSWIPHYGLGVFCDYNGGSFPRSVTIYQGRLVFGGFPEQPLEVALSCVYDFVVPGNNFSSFQIDSFANTASDALSFTVASSPNDRVNAVIEWRNSLFVFTRQAAFRAFGNSGSIQQTDRLISLISNQGLVNNACVTKTDKNILFLTDIGIYNLVTTLSTGGTEFLAGEQSVKIRPIFGITTNPQYESLPWMAYDATNQNLYLGYPVTNSVYTTHRLFIYNTYRESWSEYSTPGYFKVFASTQYIDRLLGIGFISAVTTYSTSGVPNNLIVLKWNDSSYIDFAQYITSSGGSVSYPTTPQNIVTFTTTYPVVEYGTTLEITRQSQAFKPIPITNVNDMIVTLNGVELVFQNDWVKLPNGNVYLRAVPDSGSTLTIRLRRFVTDTLPGMTQYNVTSSIDLEHTLVYVDNVFMRETVDYTTSIVGGVYQVNLTGVSNGAVVVVGQAYPVYYFSPTFARQSFGTGKRVIHIYALFDNQDGLPTWQATDVNATSGQAAEQLAGTPKHRLDVSLAIVYNMTGDGELDYDVYGYSDIVWDDALFDIDPSAYQNQRYSLFKESISGIGYSNQLVLFSFDESTFRFAAYMIGAKLKADRYIFFSS